MGIHGRLNKLEQAFTGPSPEGKTDCIEDLLAVLDNDEPIELTEKYRREFNKAFDELG